MSVKMAGQTINDRLLAARHSIAGQGLAKSVCKATTEEMIGPKKKHLDYLIHCTNEPNVSIPQLANLLVERSQNASWVVVFKALITVHHMLCYGNERFTQYLASSNSTFQLSNFLDKSGVQGARVGYDMSPFIRRYAKYLNEKALSYRTVAFDLCKVKRGKEDGTLRTMPADKLLKTLPVLQAQLDALLEFDCSPNDLSNGVISMAFMLLFRDLIRLFACYNDGIINLLEKYFDMNKKQCRDALDLYKKFLIRMDRVAEFLKVAENVGIDKGDIPDLTKAPSSLLDALEQHLATVEGKKGSQANTPTQSASHRTNVKSGVSVLSSTSSAFTTAAASNGIDDSLKQQALAEEAAAMNQYKAKLSSPVGASTNPFLASPTRAAPASSASNTASIVDLFSTPVTSGAPEPAKASDDLLQLAGSNPFADLWPNGGASFVPDDAFNCVFGNESNVIPAAQGIPPNAPNPFATPAANVTSAAEDLFGLDSVPPGKGAPPRPPPPSTATSSPARSALDDLNDSIRMALGGTSPAPGASPAKQPLGAGVNVAPSMAATAGSAVPVSGPPPSGPGLGLAGFGDVLAPSHAGGSMHPVGGVQAPVHEPATSKVLTGDLEASLASLAENLTINKSTTSNQWSSPKNTARPGWTPQPMAATTGVGYRPMGMAAMQQPMNATGMMRPAMGVQPAGHVPMATPVLRPTTAAPPANAAAAAAALDPFGAL